MSLHAVDLLLSVVFRSVLAFSVWSHYRLFVIHANVYWAII